MRLWIPALALVAVPLAGTWAQPSWAQLPGLFSGAAADQAPPPHPHPPPREAIDACAKAKQHDACSFTIHDHSIAGTCETIPDTSTLACRPDHPPPPPPEAIAACEKAREGDACSFTIHDHQIAGTCAKGPDAAMPLACRPDHPPR